jgi:hypothetical protein
LPATKTLVFELRASILGTRAAVKSLVPLQARPVAHHRAELRSILAQ